MSRIHDALKKAEQERIAVQTTEMASAIPVETAATRQSISDAPANDAVRAAPTPSPAPASAEAGYLRFDRLLTDCAHPRWNPDPNLNVFDKDNPNARAAEQFRTLRSRLYQIRSAQPIRTLLITSSLPAEGKTFVASNLGQAIARQPDRRALVIDADIRCARLHVSLGAPSAPGLTDYLRGEIDELGVIQHGQEGNFCIIPGGNDVTDPSELLSNGRLKKLLDRVAPVFDWVILDSPPCLPIADAAILAGQCDAALLVVRAGVTPSEIAQKACNELQGKNLVGVVLNATEDVEIYGRYHYGPYSYSGTYVGNAKNRK